METLATTTKQINDMRGQQFAANFIEVNNQKPYYCGYRVKGLQQTELHRSNHFYNILGNSDIVLGMIALNDTDLKQANDLINKPEPVEFTRVNNDVNGNPRFVCHFLAFINDEDRKQLQGFDLGYNLALKKSRQLGGKKFHNKQYGGGIVFQMYDGEQLEMSNKIREIQNK